MSDTGSDDEHSMWSRPFNFNGTAVRVEESWGLGIGGTVWEGGVLLARYLSSTAFEASKHNGARCVELGAGATGLPSLVAAQLGCFSQVVVTDVEECMEAMHENVNVNLPKHCQLQPGIWRAPITHSSAAVNSSEQPQAHTTTTAQHQAPSAEAPALPGDADLHGIQTARTSISAVEHSSQAEGQHSAGTEARQHSTTVHVAELDWAQDPAFLHPPFDVVLIADVVYVPEAMEPLLKCIQAVSSPSSLILFAKYKRFAPATERFWELLPLYFDVEKIPEATFGSAPQEDVIGIFQFRHKAAAGHTSAYAV